MKTQTLLISLVLIYSYSLDRNGVIIRNVLNIKDTSISYHYDKIKILDSFCAVLFELRKHYHFDESLTEFSVKGNEPSGFFVYDLVDTLNNSVNGHIKFEEGHIYHFAPNYLYFSYSNICVLLKGKLICFKALNCKKGINNINEVIEFCRPFYRKISIRKK